MSEIKPIKPILTEEELDLELDDEELLVMDYEINTVGYRVLVSGLDENKEENGFYWRSSDFENPEIACQVANLLSVDKIPDIKKGTKELLVEVYSLYGDDEDQVIFKTNLIF